MPKQKVFIKSNNPDDYKIYGHNLQYENSGKIKPVSRPKYNFQFKKNLGASSTLDDIVRSNPDLLKIKKDHQFLKRHQRSLSSQEEIKQNKQPQQQILAKSPSVPQIKSQLSYANKMGYGKLRKPENDQVLSFKIVAPQIPSSQIYFRRKDNMKLQSKVFMRSIHQRMKNQRPLPSYAEQRVQQALQKAQKYNSMSSQLNSRYLSIIKEKGKKIYI